MAVAMGQRTSNCQLFWSGILSVATIVFVVIVLKWNAALTPGNFGFFVVPTVAMIFTAVLR